MSASQSEESQMEVISVPPTDRIAPLSDIRTRTFFIVEEQLDEDILRNALDTLIRDHWRKLGARLVERPLDKILEWHLPKVFGEKYALFEWSSKEYDHSIEKTGLPKKTQPEKGVALFPSTDDLDKWFRPSDWPFLHKDAPNVPLLHVHMSTFTDSTTVIAISFPHALGDQFGLANIMKAWLGLTKGEIPAAMIGFDNDVLPQTKEYSEYERKEVVRKGRLRVRRCGELLIVFLGFFFDLVFRQKEENYTIFFPVPVVETLKERLTKSLKEKHGTDPCLTNGDVLTGVLMKFSQIHRSSKGKIAMSQTINLRNRVPNLQGDAANAFIHNSVHHATAHFKMSSSTSIAEIAYRNRLALKQALDPKDIEIGLAVMREITRRGQIFMVCEPFERTLHVTNWTAAWRDLDFSSVVKGQEKLKRRSRRPKLLVLGEATQVRRGLRRFATNILCKTEEGYWCNFGIPVKGMKMIKEYLKKDPMLEFL